MAESWLLDTDVLIDYLRGQVDAVDFLQSATAELRISSATVAELYVGVRAGREHKVLDRFVDTFDVVPVTGDLAKQAGLWRRDYGKSHGTGLMDALIAACASASASRLVTLNEKHFPMLDNLLVPYRKG
ncbi:type II toxin-antitoxin system VapC family toxin [Thiohalophilus sp.]|uniref:type II toxin-antitoxin system VapC family toxin n=1 Tax=Thiohalophilus sp. TaxID=3028392 RepID=UPI002ACD7C9E|nr:type II toxin-antitoxin system VapC family toxin [Thiohalophilus sp.]MDZ7662833.1 type II toxin-antitoxin system VapC family toxin [Thiohalophilus sp.]